MKIRVCVITLPALSDTTNSQWKPAEKSIVTRCDLRPRGDIHDIHSYQRKVTAPQVFADRASVVGEYGGIGCPVESHLWNPNMRNWGYQTWLNKPHSVLYEDWRLAYRG